MTDWMWSMLIILVCVIMILFSYIKRLKRKYTLLEKYIEDSEEKNLKYKSGLHAKITRLEYFLHQYEYFDTSLRIFSFDRAVKILKNSCDELYIVMESHRDDSLDFYFSGYSHKGITNCPRVLTKVKETHIFIQDIFAIDENCGNGTLLLNCLFDKAKELKIDTIKGNLSNSDVEKFDKLEHFYKKNGFEVYFNPERTHGLIERKIDLEGHIR